MNNNLYEGQMSLGAMKKKDDLQEDERLYLSMVADEEATKLARRYEKDPKFMTMVATELAKKALR
jgi:hypothetical protein